MYTIRKQKHAGKPQINGITESFEKKNNKKKLSIHSVFINWPDHTIHWVYMVRRLCTQTENKKSFIKQRNNDRRRQNKKYESWQYMS